MQPSPTSGPDTDASAVPPSAPSGTPPGQGKTVALFATCVNDLMFPDTPKATVEVLERLGCTVVFPPEQTCCGQIFTNTGYYREAQPTVRTFLEAFQDYDYIVAPSGSCVGAVRHQHPMLAREQSDPGLVRAVEEIVARTHDIAEMLVNVLGVTDVGAYFPHRVTYHPTCHSLRVAQVGDAPLQLLDKVKGLTLLDLPEADQCCGFGGTFSLKNPDVSRAMVTDKARNVMSTGAEYLVTGDNMCQMNIAGVIHRNRGGITPIHLVEILARTEKGTSL